MSIDGYIAKDDGDISWLSIVEREGEDYHYSEFIKTIDTVIMGRKTYDKVLSMVDKFPHENKKCYIITRTKRPDIKNIEFYCGELKSLINKLKEREGENIFVDSGAEIINQLMEFDLIDEYIISIIPIILGEGIRLFKLDNKGIKLKLLSAETFDSGLVQLHYCKN